MTEGTVQVQGQFLQNEAVHYVQCENSVSFGHKLTKSCCTLLSENGRLEPARLSRSAPTLGLQARHVKQLGDTFEFVIKQYLKELRYSHSIFSMPWILILIMLRQVTSKLDFAGKLSQLSFLKTQSVQNGRWICNAAATFSACSCPCPSTSQ